MQNQTILLLILCVIVSLAVAGFQYRFKVKNGSTKNWFFAFLRFISIFSLLLLLINPSIKKREVYTQKPNLIFAVDNSSSIQNLKEDNNVKSLIGNLKGNEKLKERFDLRFYAFSDELTDTTNLDFEGKQTNISKTIDNLDQIYKNSVAPIVLITDGNQTYGKDYEYLDNSFSQQMYPLVVGDTTSLVDTRIVQLNVNRYAYLKNKFPVEVILNYTGEDKIISKFEIYRENQTVYSQNIEFSDNQNAQVLNFNLPADQVGVNAYKARLIPLEEENNKVNNDKNFAVEVIDQKTNVLLVSDVLHPDLGALKKSIESNERRSVTIKKSNQINNLDDYQLIILYQPARRFRSLYQNLQKSNSNYLTLTGTQTDWAFLNQVQSNYRQEITRQSEYYEPRLNSNFNSFLVGAISFDDYPPLQGTFGSLTVSANHDILVYRDVSSITTDEPLVVTLENQGRREAVIFGEGIWKWRAKSFLNNQSFDDFDDFVGRIVQYLSSNARRNRLNAFSESFYYGNSEIKIKAEYFTKNYEFDRRGELSILVKNKNTDKKQTIPMLLRNNTYEVDLSNLPAGDYDYTVRVSNENLSASGSFSVLEYNVEQQSQQASFDKLSKIAKNTAGELFFADQSKDLIDTLINDKRYTPIQKSKEIVVSLIDWKYLLIIIILILAIEWFARKYNGLI